MDQLFHDVRFAVRSLRRSPLFALVALITLGAGTGLALAMFAVVNAVLVRPLDYPALRNVEDALRALPQVDHTASITDIPLGGAVNSTQIRRSDDSDELAASRPHVLVRAITASYFDVLGIPYRRGRPLDGSTANAPEQVAVVNEEFGRRFFGAEDPTGNSVTVRGVDRRIIGVVANVREFELTESTAEPVLYTPYEQERESWMRRRVTLLVRSNDRSAGAGDRIRSAVRAAEPRVLTGRPRLMSDLVEAQVQTPRFRATLLAGFAGLAVLLASVGLGGVVAYGVSRRIPEIGLRIALGAEKCDVAVMLLRETALMTAGGVAIGLVAAVAVGRVLARFLFQVNPADPVVFAGAASTLMCIGLLAGWLPSRHATHVDPVRTLRGE